MSRCTVLSVTALAATGVLTLAGCGSSASTAAHPAAHSSSAIIAMPSMASTAANAGAPATGPHNQADVAFATDMIPHHAQAVQMADMAATKATNSQVKALAADIKQAQDPEIKQMTGWLTGWDQPVPSTDMSGMGSSSTGAMGTGMMSRAEMSRLDAVTGASFDRVWVQMMVAHHTGAVAMATTELGAGQNSQAKALAQSIVMSQTTQIGQLKTLLGQLPTA